MLRPKTLLFAAVVALFAAGCGGNGKQGDTLSPSDDAASAAETADSTLYGVCDSGTAIHTLQLATDTGDTLTISLADENGEQTDIHGGLMGGDRMAVTARKGSDGTLTATLVVNITTLLGRWTSIDRDFVIEEGGTVSTHIADETRPWTAWKMFNGQLVLSTDTFDITALGADSLLLENAEGIYVYERKP